MGNYRNKYTHTERQHAHYQKILVKVLETNEQGERVVTWKHFARVDRKQYNKLFEVTGIDSIDFQSYICMWVEHDFNYKTLLTNSKEIEKVKGLILEAYDDNRTEMFLKKKREMPDKEYAVRKWLEGHIKMEAIKIGKIDRKKRDANAAKNSRNRF